MDDEPSTGADWIVIGKNPCQGGHGGVMLSASHRAETVEASLLRVDATKTSVPVWKGETWAAGPDRGLCAHEVVGVEPARDRPDDLYSIDEAMT